MHVPLFSMRSEQPPHDAFVFCKCLPANMLICKASGGKILFLFYIQDEQTVDLSFSQAFRQVQVIQLFVRILQRLRSVITVVFPVTI